MAANNGVSVPTNTRNQPTVRHPGLLVALLAILLLLGCPMEFAAAAQTTTKSKRPPTINAWKTARTTDFIDCHDPCNGGDVHYDLTASVRIMKLLNYTYKGRTYSRDGVDEETRVMGPTMHVKPGQSLWIKLRNHMFPEFLDEAPKNVSVDEYWEMLQHPGEKIKYPFYARK